MKLEKASLLSWAVALACHFTSGGLFVFGFDDVAAYVAIGMPVGLLASMVLVGAMVWREL